MKLLKKLFEKKFLTCVVEEDGSGKKKCRKLGTTEKFYVDKGDLM